MSDSKKAEPGILQCTTAFATTVDGRKYVLRGGDTVREGHPVVKGREVYFAPLTVDYELPEKPQKPAKNEKPQSDKPKRTRKPRRAKKQAEAKPTPAKPEPSATE